MPEQQRFTLGRYWIDTVAGSDNLYRFWYDAGTGEVRRRSLKTRDLEAAKIALAAHVLTEGSGKAEDGSTILLAAVFSRYWKGHSDKKRSKWTARLAGRKILDHFGDTAKVNVLTKGGQIAFIKARRAEGYAIATIASWLSLTHAALNYAASDQQGEKGEDIPPLLLRAPTMIYSTEGVAAALDEPPPDKRNWHPTLDQIAVLMNAFTPQEEWLKRFAIIKLAFASRSEAACEVGPFCLDRRYRLLHLNPPGRRQTKKHRPSLPVPAPLWPYLSEAWADGAIYAQRGKGRPRKPGNKAQVSNEWRAVLKRAGLPKEMIPNSLRHFMATELRHAHLRYGVDRVPADEREMWMGHRRMSVHDGYGTFEPDYLASAKTAVEAILLALDAKLEQPMFRQFSAKKGDSLAGKKAG